MSISKGWRWMALGVVSVLVAACGGGGGGGGGSDSATPTSATGDFSETTYSATADAAATTALNSGSIDGFTSVPLGLSASGGAADLGSAAGVRAFVLQQAAGRHALEQSLATDSETLSCGASGTFKVTVTYSNPDTVQAGDKVSFVMNNCVFEPGDAPVNGSFTATFRSYTDEDDNSMSIVFNDFGTADAMLDGKLVITSSQNGAQLTIAYEGLTATIDGESVTWHHTISVGTSGLSLGGFIEVDGDAYQLTEVEPFTLSGTGYPTSGTLRVTDAQGDRVEIVAGAEGFTYNFYAASNTTGTPTATMQGRLYAD